MAEKLTMTLNCREVAFAPGETILEVAGRAGHFVPTLCHDPRLDPAGACRTCLVEVEGGKPVASCHTPVRGGAAYSCASSSVITYLTSPTIGTSTVTFLLIEEGSMSTWIFVAFGAKASSRPVIRSSKRAPTHTMTSQSCIVMLAS